jgi:hypothetical protein
VEHLGNAVVQENAPNVLILDVDLILSVHQDSTVAGKVNIISNNAIVIQVA